MVAKVSFLNARRIKSGEDFLRDAEFYSVAEEVTSLCKLKPQAMLIDLVRDIEKKLRTK